VIQLLELLQMQQAHELPEQLVLQRGHFCVVRSFTTWQPHQEQDVAADEV
jgi:hypothetical protein